MRTIITWDVPYLAFLFFVVLPWWCEAQWIIRVLNTLRIRRGVWIEHFDGQWRAQFLRRNAAGESWCHAYGTAGAAVLLPGGEVKQPNYVKSWKPMGWPNEFVRQGERNMSEVEKCKCPTRPALKLIQWSDHSIDRMGNEPEDEL